MWFLWHYNHNYNRHFDEVKKVRSNSTTWVLDSVSIQRETNILLRRGTFSLLVLLTSTQLNLTIKIVFKTHSLINCLWVIVAWCTIAGGVFISLSISLKFSVILISNHCENCYIPLYLFYTFDRAWKVLKKCMET